jgi:ABC-2 type transport system permease protein
MSKNKTILLTKTLIKNGDGLSLKGNSTLAKVPIIATFAILLPAIMIGISVLVRSLINALQLVGQEGIILSWGISINSAMVFLFGIFYIISTYYFSSDVESLLPLPLKPRQIVGAKFLVVTIYEYLTTAVIYIPIWLTYGIVMGSGFLYYLYGLLVYIFLPITPLAAASLIVMIIMRFTNLSKYKDMVKVIGAMIGIFLGLGINILVQSTSGSMNQEQIIDLIQKGENSLLGLTTGIFPTTRWGAEAMISSVNLSGLINILIYIGFSILVYIVILWLSELIYLRGVVGMSETSSSRKKNGSVKLDEKAEQNSVVTTYTLVELKLLFRTPIYFVNCVMINFLLPVFLFIPFIFQQESQGALQEIIPRINSPEASGIVLMVFFSIAFFLGGTNGVTSTSISREGQELFIKKYLPVSYRQQLTAKVLSGFILGLFGVLMLVLSAMFLLKLPLATALIIMLTAWLPILLTSITGLLVDLYNPKLNWDSEQKAVKQNINVLYNMLIGLILLGPLWLLLPLSSNLVLVIGILVLVYGLLCFVLLKALFTLGVRQFVRLEG